MRILWRLALSGLILAAVVFTLGTVARWSEDSTALWLNMVVYNSTFVLAAILCLLRAIGGDWRTHPWALLGAGLLLYAGGGVVFSLGDPYVGASDVSWADLLWMPFYPMAFLALLALIRRRLSLEIQHGWLDALFLGTGMFTIGLSILDDTILEDFTVASATTATVNALYVIGDLVLVVLVITTIYAFGARPPRPWWLLLASLVAFAVTDSVYLFRVSLGIYVEGELLDIGWVVAALLIGLAAYSDRAPTPAVRRLSALAVVFPMVLILVIAWMLTWIPEGPMQRLVVMTAFATLVLATVRLGLAIRDARRLAEALRQSRMDQLTGLLNRQGLQSQHPRHGAEGALVLVDLFKFRDINVSLGHDIGDQLLRIVSERLTETLREHQRLARVDGDGFAAYLPDADAEAALAVAHRLMGALEGPHGIDGVPIRLTACAGVAMASDAGEDLPALLRKAERALDQAKLEGPGTVRLDRDSHAISGEESIRLRSAIGAALDAGGDDFEIHYQPIVGVTDGRVFAFEALARFRRDGELLFPGSFIDDVNRSGNMFRMTNAVMRKALGQFRANRLDYPVTVNVGPEHVNASLVQLVLDSLAQTDSSPDQLVVEITEDALLRDPAAARPVVAELRDHGVRVFMDDFGTGWSGLASVRDLVVDGLKLDHSFVSRMSFDATAMAVVRSVSILASDLQIDVIYEGAEDEDVMDLLREQQVGYVQGFAVTRPLPMSEVPAWLALTRQPVT